MTRGQEAIAEKAITALDLARLTIIGLVADNTRLLTELESSRAVVEAAGKVAEAWDGAEHLSLSAVLPLLPALSTAVREMKKAQP